MTDTLERVQTYQQLIGGEFVVELIGETRVGNKPAVLPRLTGQATVYGTEEMRWDPADPFFEGFALSDTWGPQVGELG